MDRPRFALLNASSGQTATRRNFRRELNADLAEFNVVEGNLPATFKYDGAVVTGSWASVYWDEAWIDDLLAWVAEATDRGLPHLGVCYGHQVLADVLGGTVESMGEYEIGYREIHRVNESRLLADIPDPFVAFTTHQDVVTALPPNATPIARTEYGNHGFELGNVFTVQFHPEYDRQTAEEVTRRKDLGDERLERVLDGITEEAYGEACTTKRLFDNFTEYVVTHRQENPAAD